METGSRLKVSSDRLVKPGIEPATPGLQGKQFIYYTTAAPHKRRTNSNRIIALEWTTTQQQLLQDHIQLQYSLWHTKIPAFFSNKETHEQENTLGQGHTNRSK